VEDTLGLYDEVRTDLSAAFLLVTRSVSLGLVESDIISRSVEAQCSQALRKKYDAFTKKMNAEQRNRLERLQKDSDLKHKVGALLKCFWSYQCTRLSVQV